jgi:uncharacterized protein (TIGR03000 family)
MSRQWWRTSGLLAVAVAGVLLWPGEGTAQMRWGVGAGGVRGGLWIGSRPYYGTFYPGGAFSYGWGYYPRGTWSYTRPWYVPSYAYGYSPYAYSYPSYVYSYPSYVYGGVPARDYQSFYPADTRSPAATVEPNRVLLEVRVPTAEADVWVSGDLTRQKGAVREYLSPPLEPGGNYRYTIRAQWLEGGEMRDQTRQVPITLGQRVVVDFTRPEGTDLGRPGTGLPGFGAPGTDTPVPPPPDTAKPGGDRPGT